MAPARAWLLGTSHWVGLDHVVMRPECTNGCRKTYRPNLTGQENVNVRIYPDVAIWRDKRTSIRSNGKGIRHGKTCCDDGGHCRRECRVNGYVGDGVPGRRWT